MDQKRFLSLVLIFFIAFSIVGLWTPVQNVSAAAAITITKTTPADGAKNQPAKVLILQWASTAAQDANITYSVCLRTNNKCQGSANKWTPVGKDLFYEAKNLIPGATYYWQVRAVDNTTGRVYYADNTMFSFTTAALPGAFSKVAPASGSTNEPVDGVTLQWSPSNGATSYEYCIDTTNNNTCNAAWTSTGTVLQAKLSGLKNNTVYYWQVHAVNDSGSTLASGGWWSFTTKVVPSIFNKLSPTNFATDQLVNGLALSWTLSANADSYEYCVSPTSGSCDSWINVGKDTGASVSGLAYETTYYWQVRAVNAGGYRSADDAWWSFKTEIAPPAAFSKSDPVDGASLQPTTLTLSWAPSAGTDITYEYCFDTVQDITACNGQWTNTGTSTSAEITNLEYGLTYYWQVRANNSSGSTDANNGQWWSFVTKDPPPAGFGKSSPADGSNPVAVDAALTWTAADGNNVTYWVCYDAEKVNNFTCDSSWQLAGSTLTFLPNNLDYAKDYYWQVRATNPTGSTLADGGLWWHFTTAPKPPAYFSKVFPKDGAENLPINLMLTWDANLVPGMTYQYCLDMDATPNTTCESGWKTVTSTFATLSLAQNQQYVWQVRAVNSANVKVEANNGVWWTFKTAATPPEGFVKILPGANDTSQPTTPVLIWSASPNATGYQYCYYPVTTPPSVNTCQTDAEWQPTSAKGQTATFAQITTPLLPDQEYMWQVRAINGGNTTQADSSTFWTFKTLPALPQLQPQTFTLNEDNKLTEQLDTMGATNLKFYLEGRIPPGDLKWGGDGSFTYTPPKDFAGTEHFSYVYTDGVNPTAGPVDVTINVNNVEDPPSLNPVQPITVGLGKMAAFIALGTDPDLPYGDQLTYSIVSPAKSGAKINPADGTFTWVGVWKPGTPTTTFTIRVTDIAGDYAEQTVEIIVLPLKKFMPVISH